MRLCRKGILNYVRLSSKTGGENKKNHVYVTSWIVSGGSVGKLYILLRVQILSLKKKKRRLYILLRVQILSLRKKIQAYIPLLAAWKQIKIVMCRGRRDVNFI